jgi:hypothetical protein
MIHRCQRALKMEMAVADLVITIVGLYMMIDDEKKIAKSKSENSESVNIGIETPELFKRS